MAEQFLQTSDSGFVKERSGITRISPIFIIPGPGGNGGSEPYGILNDWEPSEKPLNLPAVDRSAAKDVDGDWKLTINFEGATSDAALQPLLEIDDTSVDSPIEASEVFEELVKKWGPIVSDDDGQFKGWPRKIKDGTGATVKNPFYGTNHFADGNTILRVTFGLRDFNSDLFRNMRCIDSNPLVPEGQGGNISQLIQDGQTFLKKSLKGQYRGNVWLYTLEYWLGKWSEDLYAPKN